MIFKCPYVYRWTQKSDAKDYSMALDTLKTTIFA
jgi:hypothetical protein